MSRGNASLAPRSQLRLGISFRFCHTCIDQVTLNHKGDTVVIDEECLRDSVHVHAANRLSIVPCPVYQLNLVNSEYEPLKGPSSTHDIA